MGQHEYRLKSFADDELLAGLSSIVGRRNQITAEFLAYLAELDERQIFLDLGFASLFEYCVERLGLCESTAGRHIAAARVCRHHPQVFARVASGALHASALSLLRKHLTAENAEALFDLCEHRSMRKIEELLATRFPRPDVRDLVRRLPAQARPTLDAERGSEQRPTEPPCEMTAIRQQPFVESHPNGFRPPDSRQHEPSALNAAEAAAEAAEATHAANAANATKQRRLEPLSADRYGVHFTADGEFRELLERVRGLAGHRLPSGDLMTLLKRGLEAYERELEKERFAVGSRPRRSRGVAPAPSAPSEAKLSATDLPKPELSTSNPSNLDAQSTRTQNQNQNQNRSPKPKRRCSA